ncbi:hypothetical protein V8G56_07415 [Gaetbulibacter aquiaggeris]|uniref:MORN repeat protein n=1 Tax=Gaetbulibacter aquiaggeris TaxID=1735373 RepID=A0ABW7MP14_9FLAO
MKCSISVFALMFFSHLSFSQENGLFEMHYDNGQLKVSGEYKNQERVGEWKEYFENGTLSHIYSYHKGKKIERVNLFLVLEN